MLLCTDVAARGLDFPAVTHIIQNDPPGDVPDYVQRVGRAARMGRRGVALLMLAPQELDYTKALEAVGVAIAQQKLFPSLDALPKPPALSKSAAAEADERRRMFQVAMDSAHNCQVSSLTHFTRGALRQSLSSIAELQHNFHGLYIWVFLPFIGTTGVKGNVWRMCCRQG